jgi:hypothetical protein
VDCSPLFSLGHDFVTSDFHIFGPLKDAFRGRRFADNDLLKHIMREKLGRFSKELYADGIQLFTQSWKNCFGNEGEFVEK